ncbi:hypothetical protein OG559_22330 [Micromonospora sp. NBC_01405]|uniref:hypothetical protein n=1 Tax=Micromonospora sp. NBC_01405 TaxID=2903589 RepID=UPI00324A37F9
MSRNASAPRATRYVQAAPRTRSTQRPKDQYADGRHHDGVEHHERHPGELPGESAADAVEDECQQEERTGASAGHAE